MSPNSREKDSLIERVFNFIRVNNLAPKGETLIVGVSGGPDSVCLLHILMRLSERLEIDLYVAHMNHLLRGAESDAEAQYVCQLATELGVNATLEKRDVEAYRKKHRLSLEEAAREVRYQFFADLARSIGVNQIAVGHNANDQAETILMHLVRGTGVHGLQGMHPLTQLESLTDNNLILIRPLLETSREEIESYCQQNNLTPRRDSSNLSPSHLRNRIRSELIPLLQEYNPRINEALLRTADSLAVDSSFLHEHASQIWDKIVMKEEDALVLNSEGINSLHPALQRYLLREASKRLLGDLKDIELKHIEKMRAALEMKPGKRINLPRGLTFHVERGIYRMTRE